MEIEQEISTMITNKNDVTFDYVTKEDLNKRRLFSTDSGIDDAETNSEKSSKYNSSDEEYQEEETPDNTSRNVEMENSFHEEDDAEEMSELSEEEIDDAATPLSGNSDTESYEILREELSPVVDSPTVTETEEDETVDGECSSTTGHVNGRVTPEDEEVEKIMTEERSLKLIEQEKGTSQDVDVKNQVDSKEELRDELQSLLKVQSDEMKVLTETITSTVNVSEKENHLKNFDQHNINDHAETTEENVSDKEDVTGVDDIEMNEEADETEATSTPADQTTAEQKSSAAENPTELTITRKSLRDRKNKEEETVIKKQTKKVATTSSTGELFKDLNLKVTQLEGHHEDVVAVDLYEKFIISGGRDTSLKLWIAGSDDELKSLGGHEGTITGVRFITDTSFSTYPNVVTSSYDCSIRVWDLEKGSSIKSIYVYSPVVCLDYSNGLAAIGTEGGKVEVYNISSGDQLFSVNAYEEAVSAIKFGPNGLIAAGSSDGVVKVFNQNDSSTPVFTSDQASLTMEQTSSTDNVVSKQPVVRRTKINCIGFQNETTVCYGDEGYNLKVVDFNKGTLKKVCNNLKEYCPTEALCISTVQNQDYLFSIGSDVDTSDGYINVRSFPSLEYLGTIRDESANSGSMTSLCVQEVESRLRIVTCGKQLRIWDQVAKRGRKRKNDGDDDSLIPCKFICNYTENKDSEPESETDSDTDTSSQTSSKEISTTGEPQPRSYCTIL